MNIKISLIDNDYVVQAKTDLIQNRRDDTFRNFIEQVEEELVTGKDSRTIHLKKRYSMTGHST